MQVAPALFAMCTKAQIMIRNFESATKALAQYENALTMLGPYTTRLCQKQRFTNLCLLNCILP
jgi:hypothetical protein